MLRSTKLPSLGSCQRLSRSTKFTPGINFQLNKSVARRASTSFTNESKTGRWSPRWRRRFPSLVCAGIFVCLGVTYGFDLGRKMSQPPTPGSLEDKQDVEKIRSTYETLPIVSELRANPDFEELGSEGGEIPEEDKARFLTAGPMGGCRGLPIQRIFWNEKEKLSVSVVFFGPGLEGWPSFVHGGAISVVLDERLGRVALRVFPEGTGVTANLNIDYRAPVISSNFYIVHAKYDDEKSTERKAYVDGTIHDISGNLCAEATGLFVVPKTLKLERVREVY